MTQNEPEFGVQKRESIYEQYIGQYILVYPFNSGTTFSGKLVEIKDEHIILNPHESAEYDPEKGLTRKLIDKNAIIHIPVVAIEPITKENIEAYCIFQNNKDLKKLQEQVRKNQS